SATRKVPGRLGNKAWKLVLQALASGQVKEIEVEVKGLMVVGRIEPESGSSKADVDLSPYNAGTLGVSRQHLILIPADDGPCIIDLNSTNGTWVNGLYLQPGQKYLLRTGDRLELGSLKILARVVPPPEQTIALSLDTAKAKSDVAGPKSGG